MKKLLLGSASLLMFSCAIIIFQISCKKDVIAQNTSDLSSKIIFAKSQNLKPYTFWIADYDGSNATQLSFDLPNWRIDNVKFSQDSNKLILQATDSASLIGLPICELFTSNINGTNVQRITHENSSGIATTLIDVR